MIGNWCILYLMNDVRKIREGMTEDESAEIKAAGCVV